MNALLTATGGALLHFLWQGLVIGAVLSGVLTLLADRDAAERYVACLLGMAAMLLAPIVTTWLLLRAPGGPWDAVLGPLAAPIAHGAHAASGLASPLQPLLPVLPLFWGAGVIALQLRMVAAYVVADRLRRRDTRAAPPAWQREFDELRARFGLARVRLVESARVAVPSVVGALRPVVLVPASLATGLGRDEIRGLLAHELAHVRRHDYLVNAAQCLFESLLFFHPVTWWLSGRLRAEREFCCDDAAVRVGGGAFAYARTLSFLEELRGRTALPVLSATGGSLMNRILRILGGAPRRNRATFFTGALTVAVGLTLGSLMAAGCFRGEERDASLAGPAGGAQAAPAAVEQLSCDSGVPVPLSPAYVMNALEAAAAGTKMSAEMLADVRAKIISGEWQAYSAACAPEAGAAGSGGACLALTNGTTCEGLACDPANCPLTDCKPGDCPINACLDVAASGDGEPFCVAMHCDEAACPQPCDPAAAGAMLTTLVERIDSN
jgi:beta-lactamase regulating signal transducer with metallopeptidase domain